MELVLKWFGIAEPMLLSICNFVLLGCTHIYLKDDLNGIEWFGIAEPKLGCSIYKLF
jgi:hypothetical protein